MSAVETGSFRAAIEAEDVQALEAALSPGVVFRSPAVFKPYEGRDAAMAVLRMVFEVLEDFRYTLELRSGDHEVLVFEARVEEREVQGIDLIRLGPDGEVIELTVMIRPFSGLNAVREAMAARLG